MSSLTTLPKKFASGGHQIRPRGAQRVNPIKAIQDREWRRKQMAAQAAQAGGASAAAGHSSNNNNNSGTTPSEAGGSPPPSSRPPPRAGAAASSRLQCPNKACKNPNVVDGTCRTCGRVADDSNIVAEVSFGENAQGAAVVQGSFLGHDQGGIRPMAGIGHRRVAGNGSAEARERTLREARLLMTGYAHQLHIPEHTVTVGFQYYKLASGANFVQGRKIQNVVAVCLYAACRKSTEANPCKIMLIDLADLVREEVFFLGRTFKKLLQTIEVAARDVQPIYVEDLIFRFASKLEFDTMTNKVAETAVRLVQRMDRDWIVMGRRPAGICGACLIMAARMYNFRRTVREVVYIAKVTMATLQLRLDEFKELPSAKMTVEEFLAQDFLSEEFDPPSIYKKSAEYQAKLQERKRALKRKRGSAALAATGGDNNSATASPSLTPQTPASVYAELQSQPRIVDADGFAVPALPQRKEVRPGTSSPRSTRTRPRVEQDFEDEADDQLDALAAQFGADEESATGSPPETTSSAVAASSSAASRSSSAAPQGPPAKRRRGPDGSSCRTLPANSNSRNNKNDNGELQEPDYVDDEWRADEENLEMEMTEAINSPGCLEHARAFANAEQRAQLIMMGAGAGGAGRAGSAAVAPAGNASGSDDASTSVTASDAAAASGVSESPEIAEDEFKDDPEVQFCLLSEEEAAAKEKIWMNENRAYLRMRQEKEFRAKIAAAHGGKKQTRRRNRKPRIGEGQSSPASTPGEAAVEAMERRGFSKRINYDAMRRMLDRPGNKGAGAASASSAARSSSIRGADTASVFSGYTYSRAGSSAGSVLGDEDEDEDDEDAGAGADTAAALSQNSKGSAPSKTAQTAGEDDYDDDEDDEDGPVYDEEDEPEIDPFAEDDPVEDEDEEEPYDDE